MTTTTIPSRAELPTAAGLVRSTITAALAAGAILVTVVLPAEYAIDPTGLGGVLGFTEMGEIKAQLASDADADRKFDFRNRVAAQVAAVEAAASGRPELGAAGSEAQAPSGRSDKMSIMLRPGEGGEVKLQMKAGEKAKFNWTAKGGAVNVDLHGDNATENVSYAKQRGITTDTGTITAKFDGNHGWYWRNRSASNVEIFVEANGSYEAMKRMM